VVSACVVHTAFSSKFGNACRAGTWALAPQPLPPGVTVAPTIPTLILSATILFPRFVHRLSTPRERRIALQRRKSARCSSERRLCFWQRTLSMTVAAHIMTEPVGVGFVHEPRTTARHSAEKADMAGAAGRHRIVSMLRSARHSKPDIRPAVEMGQEETHALQTTSGNEAPVSAQARGDAPAHNRSNPAWSSMVRLRQGSNMRASAFVL